MKPFFSIQNVLTLEQFKYLDKLDNDVHSSFHSKNYTDRGQMLGLSTEKDMPEDMMNEVYGMIKDEVEKEDKEDEIGNKEEKQEQD